MFCFKRNEIVRNNRSFGRDTIKWKPFLRQLMVVSSAWSLNFILGLRFGTTTVLIPQLRRANITVSDETISWMSSAMQYAGIPWIFIHCVLTCVIGWKKTCILVSVSTIINNILFYFSTTPTILLIYDVFFGVTQGATCTIYIVVTSEYTSPEYRGMFLCIKAASFLSGVWVANAIGAFTYWRYIPVISLIASLITLTVFFWPESPHWLATKNRFTECRRAHRLLKGYGKSAELELNKLIQSQIDSPSSGIYVVSDLRFVLQREFFLPIFICMLALLSYILSGKIIITAYAVDMIKKLIKDDIASYRTMLILDGITVLCAFVGSFIAKRYSRRTIWFVTFGLAIVFLLILSLYTYLVKLFICSENIYLSIFLLVGYSISISCGPMVLGAAWSGELIPYRYKRASIVIVAVWFLAICALFLKTSPVIVRTFDLHGTLLFYALSSGFCICVMYFYLPETKNKTLKEIEECFKDKKAVEESRSLVS